LASSLRSKHEKAMAWVLDDFGKVASAEVEAVYEDNQRHERRRDLV